MIATFNKELFLQRVTTILNKVPAGTTLKPPYWSNFILVPDGGTHDPETQVWKPLFGEELYFKRKLFTQVLTNDEYILSLKGVDFHKLSDEARYKYTLHVYPNEKWSKGLILEDISQMLTHIPPAITANEDEIIDIVPAKLETALLTGQMLEDFNIQLKVQEICLDYIKHWPSHENYSCQYLPILEALNTRIWGHRTLYSDFILDTSK